MPKVLVLVVAAAIAVGAGLALPTDAVRASATSLSSSQLNDELGAISRSPAYQCYLQAKVYLRSGGTAPGVSGAVGRAWSGGAAVEWTNARAIQLAQIHYVGATHPELFSPAKLAAARASLSNEIYSTNAAAYQQSSQTSSPFSCSAAAGGNQTLASLPAWFVDEQVKAHAATLGLVALLPSRVPESGPGLEAWFHQHAALFATTCVAVVVLPDLATAKSVAAKIDGGLTLAQAARTYSIDAATKSKGGAIGCFAPTSPDFATVEQDVGRLAIGKVAIFPSSQGTAYFLLGPSKRTPNAYAAITAAVAAQAHNVNLQQAQLLAAQVQRDADVVVDPAIGTWVPSTLGGTIAPAASPATDQVVNAGANAPPPSPLVASP